MYICFEMAFPIPAASTSGITSASSPSPRWSATPISAPGMVPALPAVGAATMRPMRAFSSFTAIA